MYFGSFFFIFLVVYYSIDKPAVGSYVMNGSSKFNDKRAKNGSSEC